MPPRPTSRSHGSRARASSDRNPDPAAEPLQGDHRGLRGPAGSPEAGDVRPVRQSRRRWRWRLRRIPPRRSERSAQHLHADFGASTSSAERGPGRGATGRISGDGEALAHRSGHRCQTEREIEVTGALLACGLGRSEHRLCRLYHLWWKWRVRRAARSMFGQFVSVSPCPTCAGEGRIITTPAKPAVGKRGREDKTVQVDIPPGV